jgi:hypothetical protein
VLVGVFVGDSIPDGLGALEWAPATLLLFAVGLPTGMLLILAIHEGGHTLAGYLAGFQLRHVSVGPLKLQRTASGWKVSRSQNDFFGGMSHGVPGPTLQNAPEDTLIWSRAVRLAGGSAANILTGGLALGLASMLSAEGMIAAEGGAISVAALRYFGAASLLVGVLNLIPFRTQGGLITDGGRLWSLLDGSSAAGRDVALAIVRAEAYGGTRPSDWGTDRVERMRTPRDYGVTDGSTFMLSYRHALDAGRTEEAHAYLAEALKLLDRLPYAQHEGLMVEAAYFESAYRGDAAAARAWLEEVGPSPTGVPTCAIRRAEAATLLAEGKPEEARQRISEAETALSEHPAPGTAIAEQEWLRDLDRQASRVES